MVVKWLEMPDIHLIITHLHQAVVDYYWGNLTEVMERLYQELRFHKGFPYSESLLDAFLYLQTVKEIVEETLKISITEVYI
jgi:hypothetical protein